MCTGTLHLTLLATLWLNGAHGICERFTFKAVTARLLEKIPLSGVIGDAGEVILDPSKRMDLKSASFGIRRIVQVVVWRVVHFAFLPLGILLWLRWRRSCKCYLGG